MSWFTEHIKSRRDRNLARVAASVTLAGIIASGITVIKTNQLADECLAEVNRQFERVDPITPAETAALRTYMNSDHLTMAQTLGISGIEDEETLNDLVQRGELLELTNNPYYVVQEMEYGSPHVTPSTKNLLELIGIRFQQALFNQGLPPYKLVISSAIRTAENQKALRGVNRNAAEKSSHLFGTTVDILYSVFVYDAEQDTFPSGFWISDRLMRWTVSRTLSDLTETKQTVLKAVLGRVLRQLQREDYMLVIYERKQPVYHVTLARDIPDPSSNGVPPHQKRP